MIKHISNIASDPNQEILKILAEWASQMAIKELLKKVYDDKMKQKIDDYLKHHNISKDQIAVSLKENPGLYTVLHDKNAYEKYVRLDEGHGLVILDPSAGELVKMYARDDSFYEVKLMKDAITRYFGNNDVGIVQVIENASKKRSKNIDPTKWSNRLEREGERYKGQINDIKHKLNSMWECKVKVIEFEYWLQIAITDCSIFPNNTTDLCTEIVEQTGLEGFHFENSLSSENLLNHAMIVYEMCSHAADQITRLSVKSNTSIDSPYEYIGIFLSKILSQLPNWFFIVGRTIKSDNLVNGDDIVSKSWRGQTMDKL